MIGDVAGNDRAGANHGAFAYRNTGENSGIAADRGTAANAGGKDFPVRIRLQLTLRVRGARTAVIGEYHSMPDENLIGDLDAFADEAVRRDFAAVADDGIFLYFDKRPNLRFITDATSI
jgi:hypothetical protein